MKAKLIAKFFDYDDCWEKLAEEYQYFDLDSFVSRAKIIAPEVFLENPEIEEVIEYEIQNQNDNHILTWEDGMGEAVRIYQKI